MNARQYATRTPNGVITFLVKKSHATSVLTWSRMNFCQVVSPASPRRWGDDAEQLANGIQQTLPVNLGALPRQFLDELHFSPGSNSIHSCACHLGILGFQFGDPSPQGLFPGRFHRPLLRMGASLHNMIGNTGSKRPRNPDRPLAMHAKQRVEYRERLRRT